MESSRNSFSKQKFKWIFFAQTAWFLIVCLMGSWWGWLIFRQAENIAKLEERIGTDSAEIAKSWLTTQRMLKWEVPVFYFLLLLASIFLIWLYWRDEKRNREVRSFFASLTHEMRTPLTSIRLQAETIADSMTQLDKNWPLMNRLLEDTNRIENQVEKSLELARLEGGGPIFLNELDLIPPIKSVIENWKHLYSDQVKLKFHLEDSTVLGDPHSIQIILRNLLENSIRHSSKNLVNIEITGKPKNGLFEVVYRDDSGGYAGEKRKLGHLFFKGKRSQGTGVGLYLISILMEKMKGKVKFIPTTDGFQVNLYFKRKTTDSGVDSLHD